METSSQHELGAETWEYYGSCAELIRAGAEALVDEYFFPNFQNGGRAKVRIAAKICRTCPVALRCLEKSLETEVDGIWSGLTPADRRRIRESA